MKDQDADELKSDNVDPIHREIDNVKKSDSFDQIVNEGQCSRSGIRLIGDEIGLFHFGGIRLFFNLSERTREIDA